MLVPRGHVRDNLGLSVHDTGVAGFVGQNADDNVCTSSRTDVYDVDYVGLARSDSYERI